MQSTRYHRNLYQYIVEEIGQRIVKGLYPAGDVLPTEDRLSEELQVSRGVLREATKVLTQKGLIQMRPRIGTQVLPRDHWNLFDPDILVWRLQVEDKTTFLKNVTEVRRLIECEAARQAACRATQTEVSAIMGILKDMRRLLEDQASYNYEDYLSIDISFHTKILEASHNELLSQIGRTIRNAVHKARQSDAPDIDIQRESLPYHAAIAEGIDAKNPEAAYKASQDMFENVWQHLTRE